MTYVKKPNNPLLELTSEFSKGISYKVNIKDQFYFSILATLKNKILKIPLTNNVCMCMCVWGGGGNDKIRCNKNITFRESEKDT